MPSNPMLILLLAVAPLLSCAQPRPEAPSPSPDAGDGRVVGTVRVVGSAPVNVQVVVRRADGGNVRVVGPLSEEVRRLSGAEVAVSGPLEPSPDPMADGQIRADGYEILSVDGRPVITGVVESRTGEWTLLRTAAGEPVYLSGAPAELRVGQKVWVQGPRSVVVQSYGVLTR